MKKGLLAVVIGILLALLVGGIVMSNKKTSTPGSDTNTDEDTETSLMRLLTKGASQECTFETEADGYSSSGTFYVSSGKTRGDFTSTSEGQSLTSHMIVDGSTSYLWMDGQKTGYKSTVEASSETDGKDEVESSSTSTSTNFDVSQEMDYKCKAWNADSSKFDLPEGVEFMTLGEVQTGGVDKCSVCSSLDGESKTQCLSALGC